MASAKMASAYRGNNGGGVKENMTISNNGAEIKHQSWRK